MSNGQLALRFSLLSVRYQIEWSSNFLLCQGPLAGCFPLLSLRTCKADVVVGIDQETANHLDRSEEKWRVNGRSVSTGLGEPPTQLLARYALISFSPANGT
jgi:hypothetical protein